MSRTVFRVFLSSTFGDFQLEREALKERVWPELERLCTTHGASFQVVDLRWGISPDAALSHETIGICLDEVRRCQKLSPRPNFVMLVGDRYGWRPAPVAIPADEFQAVLAYHASDRAASTLLKCWYRLDRNAASPAYLLQPRDADHAAWAMVENRLLSLLRDAAQTLGITPERRELYFLSATHLEIVHGLLRSTDARDHVFAFERRIDGLPDSAPEGIARRFSDYSPNGSVDSDATRLRRELVSEIATVLPAEHIRQYSARWIDAWEQPLTTTHLDQLCAEVSASLRGVIASQLAEEINTDPLENELAGQEQFCGQRTSGFLGRKRELSIIAGYARRVLSRKKPQPPLILHGPGGSGKSALIATAITGLQAAHPDALLLYRFIGVTPRSWTVESCLSDLINEVARATGQSVAEIESPTARKLGAQLFELLTAAAEERPVLLVLDALDQFGGNVRLADILPRELSPRLGLILSVLDGPQQQALTALYPQARTVPLPVLKATECRQLLDQVVAPRVLTAAQRKDLLASAALDGRPLYLALLAPLARRLKSWEMVPELPATVEELVRFVLGDLASRHGQVLTSHALAYLQAARFGLSETELQQVLWRDAEVRAEFERTKNPDQPPVDALPPVLWSRLYAELDPYLNEQWEDGALLYRFFHRVFAEQATTFAGGELISFHVRLADYFNDLPLYVDQTVNARKVMELPWQLVQAGRLGESRKLVTDFDFAMAKCRLNRSDDWAEDFARIKAAASEPDQPRDWRIWESFVRRNRHILRRGDDDWPAHKILLQLSVEHADDSPATVAAEKFLAEGKCDWAWLRRERRAEKAGVDPCVAVFEGHESYIEGMAIFSDGRILTWSDDGTLRIWSQTGDELTLLLHNHWVGGATILEDDKILSWSGDGTVRLWDTSGVQILVLNHGSLFTKGKVLNNGNILTWDNEYHVMIWDGSGVILKNVLIATTDEEIDEIGELIDIYSAFNDKLLFVYKKALFITDYDLEPIIGWNGEFTGAVPISDDLILTISLDGSLAIRKIEGETLALLKGHTDVVLGWEILPGNRILSWSEDGSLRLWSSDGAPISTFTGHSAAVLGAMVLPNNQILSWSKDGTLRVWEDTGSSVAILDAHLSWVRGARYTSDGKILSYSSDTTLKLWDLTGVELGTFRGHSGEIYDAIIFKDGSVISREYIGKRLLKWDIGIEANCNTSCGDAGLALDFLVTNNGSILYWYYNFNNNITMMDKNGAWLKDLEGHASAISGVKELSDGKFLSWSKDNTARVWGCDGECISVLNGDYEPQCFLSNGNIIAKHGGSTMCILTKDLDIVTSLTGHQSEIKSINVLQNDNILSQSSEGELRLWRMDGTLLSTMHGEDGAIAPGFLSILPDGRFLTRYLGLPTMHLWSESGSLLAEMKGHPGGYGSARVNILPDGRILSWCGKELRLWHDNGALFKIVNCEEYEHVNGAIILSNGKLLTWHFGGRVFIWSDYCVSTELYGHVDCINEIIELQDGNILSWSDYDDRMCKWNYSGELLVAYRGDSRYSAPDEYVCKFNSSDLNCDGVHLSAKKNRAFVGCERAIYKWQTDSECFVHKLYPDGRSVVTTGHKNIYVLNTYYSNIRESINQLKSRS